MSGNQFIGGLLLGALVGSITALMMAPSAGQENRRMLQERWNRIRRRGEEMTEQSSEMLR